MMVSLSVLAIIASMAGNSRPGWIDVPADYPTIQAAIDAADEGDQIVIAPGTYNEHDISLRGKAIAIRSTDPLDPAVVEATVVDGDSIAGVFRISEGEGPRSSIEGLKIVRGYAANGAGILCLNVSPTISRCVLERNQANSEGGGGGGIACLSSHPLIEECTLRENIADHGGGIHCESSSPLIRSCTFNENAGLDNGGGISCFTGSAATIAGCEFRNNAAYDKGGGAIYVSASTPYIVDCVLEEGWADDGGGIYFTNDANSLVVRSTIQGNSVFDRGGGIAVHSSAPVLLECDIFANWAFDFSGGGIDCEEFSQITLRSCRLDRNTAYDHGGGGLYCLKSEAALFNCSISGNAAGQSGPGVFVDRSVLSLTNCTLEGNSTYGDEGGITTTDSDVSVVNSVLWGNSPSEVTVKTGAPPSITYSDIAGGWTGTGNIDEDPVFIDEQYHIAAGSPCRDAGSLNSAPTIDFDGDLRPEGGLPDIGFDEWRAGPPCELKAIISDHPLETTPGASVGLTVHLDNRCSRTMAADYIVAQVRGALGRDLLISDEIVELGPWETVDLERPVRVPPGAPIGTYAVALFVYRDEDLIGTDLEMTRVLAP